jgi:putative colanic acid biosynthesis acetyltransferase WcaF
MSEVKTKKSIQSPTFSLSHKLIRILWAFVYTFFFRVSPKPFFNFRSWLLRCFGSSIENDVHVYPTVKIWLPANLKMASGSTIGPDVNIYNQGSISIGRNTIVSQGAHLCASTHDYNNPLHPLVLAPITIEDNVWICADAFIGPGVTAAEGCVVGARAVITKDTECWSVYGGNPAKKVNERNKFE